MKKTTLMAALLIISLAAFSVNLTITNVGYLFSPATITIDAGNDIYFMLESMHNTVKVIQATWDANGTIALPGGFSVPLGGGQVLTTQLTVGTH